MLSSAVANAQVVDGFQPFTCKPENRNPMSYRLFVPENPGKENLPLIVHFHGAGSRGNDNLKQITWTKCFATKEMQARHPCFILAPQCPDPLRWVDTDWALLKHQMPPITAEMQNAVEIIEEVLAKYPVDRRRIYLTGQSMGGFAVWDILCRRPDLFAAAVPVCGGGDESKAPLIKDIPIWAFHGAKDPTVKVERSRNMIEALKKAGGAPLYTEYPDVEHSAWVPAYKEEKLPDWLFGQTKP
ncbi:MAG: prolyl oligopeptidase family serine peptidase [Verrucomicrobiae bacterium]|nr:prolyl oligopeptidase family serine peptidase [Verrucomicrobiae bacterium]